MENELEIKLQGNPDMVITCISNFVKAPIAGFQYKVNIRVGDAPDHTKWDRTYNAYCDVALKHEGGDVELSTIRLQLLPKEQTLFSVQKPQHMDSPIGHFLDHLQQEFKRLGYMYPEKGVIAQKEKYTVESPMQLFDALQLHPKVIEASRACFVTDNYREAILNAFISLAEYVKDRTKLEADNRDLMAKAFSLDKPVIKLNSLKNKYERDEQEGFRFLYMGAWVGIRNPKAHKLIPQSNPLHTLEYLALASLLIRRVGEGEIS